MEQRDHVIYRRKVRESSSNPRWMSRATWSFSAAAAIVLATILMANDHQWINRSSSAVCATVGLYHVSKVRLRRSTLEILRGPTGALTFELRSSAHRMSIEPPFSYAYYRVGEGPASQCSLELILSRNSETLMTLSERVASGAVPERWPERVASVHSGRALQSAGGKGLGLVRIVELLKEMPSAQAFESGA